jgi:non-specific serine/threonine protein kinase
VLEGIASLVDKGVLRQVDSVDAGSRYVMLETLREFGLERLEASGEAGDVRGRHAAWCVSLAEQAELSARQHLRPGDVERLEVERQNLLAALTWLDEAGHGEVLLRLAAVLGWSWYLEGRFREGRRWLERALAAAPQAPLEDRAVARVYAGQLAHTLGDDASAVAHLDQGVTLARHCQDAGLAAFGEMAIGMIAEDRGDYDPAEAHFTAARTLYGRANHPRGPITATYHLGVVAYGRGELGRARALLDEALTAGQALGDPLSYSWCLRYLALVAIKEGDLPRAAAALREVVTHGAQGALQHNWDETLATLAVLGAAGNQAAPAAQILGAGETVRAAHGEPFALPERADYEWAAARARAVLGEEAFAHAWATGQAMSTEAIEADIQTILAAAEEEAPQSRPVVHAGSLTLRELEVLRLLAEGRSDKEIAEALFVSQRTVQTHTEHIYAKLGVHGRSEAAAVAVRRGLA